MAGLLQLRQRPEIAGTDGITGGAITRHFHPAQIFQQCLGAGDIRPEFRRGLLRRPDVRVAVAGQLMPLGHQAADQIGMPLRHPAQGEKRRLDSPFGKQIENAMGVARDPPRPLFPLLAGDVRLERRDLEIILHIHGHGVKRR